MGYSKALQEKLEQLTKLQEENRQLLKEIKQSIDKPVTVSADEIRSVLETASINRNNNEKRKV